MEHGGRPPGPLFQATFGPNGQALPHCGTCSSLRGAFNVLPVAELLVVDARTSAACPKQLSTKSTSQEEKGQLVHLSRCQTNAHQSEYVAACYKRREFISQFSWSAGTAVITNDRALD
jgi:hypothetical protein